MSIREDIAKNIVERLKEMVDPQPVLVTREPFDVEKLAITQFPAVLVVTGNEERIDYSFNKRQGSIVYNLRGFVRGGPELDRQKNDLIERIEEQLAVDVTRGTNIKNVTTEIQSIEVIDRIPPLGEIAMTVQVRYLFNKGTL